VIQNHNPVGVVCVTLEQYSLVNPSGPPAIGRLDLKVPPNVRALFVAADPMIPRRVTPILLRQLGHSETSPQVVDRPPGNILPAPAPLPQPLFVQHIQPQRYLQAIAGGIPIDLGHGFVDRMEQNSRK
jgi:hypothetical protein